MTRPLQRACIYDLSLKPAALAKRWFRWCHSSSSCPNHDNSLVLQEDTVLHVDAFKIIRVLLCTASAGIRNTPGDVKKAIPVLTKTGSALLAPPGAFLKPTEAVLGLCRPQKLLWTQMENISGHVRIIQVGRFVDFIICRSSVPRTPTDAEAQL